MMHTFLIAWLSAFTVIASAVLGMSMLGCMLRLGGSDLWIAWRPAFVAAARSPVIVALLYVPILFGMHLLYPWSVDADFAAQRWFLNTPFAVIRAIVYFVAWAAAGQLALAESGSVISKTAAALIILFFTANFAAIDWIMALTPHWHSSVFGLRWCVDGLLIAAAIIVSWRSHPHRGMGADALRPRIDGANLLFALNLGWLYLIFVDYITAWSGNLPDEAGWYVARLAGDWRYVIFAIVACHILVGAVLLVRAAKRSASILLAIAALTIALQWIESVWTIVPSSDANAFAITGLSLVIVAACAGSAKFATRLGFPTSKHREVRTDG